jgi:hypothetical protein
MDRDTNRALLSAYRNNMIRYQKLLETHVTEVEQNYIKERLSAYRAAVKALEPPIFNLAEVNEHCLRRIVAEWQEAFDLIWKINCALLAGDKIRVYRDWLKNFSHRRIEDANYAMEAARYLRGT